MGIQATTFEALGITCLAAGTVAAEVRQRVALRLGDWNLSWLAPDIQLIAAELVTNACAATPGDLIGVRLSLEDQAVILAVWDASEQMPQPQPVQELEFEELDLSEENLDNNGGRGLQIVQALASECGVTRTEPMGKWVWARFRI